MSLRFNALPSDREKAFVKAKYQNKQPTSTRLLKKNCATYLNDALIKSGVHTSITKAGKCWSHPGVKNLLRAEKVAEWLKASKFSGIRKLKRINPKTFQDDLNGRTGIIFFKDYWQRGKESFENRSGDHIDLWNKDEITSSSMFTRSILEFFGRVSDLNKSHEVWFWEVK